MKRTIYRLFAAGLLTFAAAANVSAEQVVLHTSRGPITLDLYSKKSPATVANFLQYARDGFYNGTIFHRVIPRFMVQGGGFTQDMEQKPTRDPVVNEAANRLNNDRWTVAMARTDDPDSATSQFFINLRMNIDLDHRGDKPGYTVFGEVIDGQHVVREISLVQTHQVGGHGNVPVEPVMIERVEIVE